MIISNSCRRPVGKKFRCAVCMPSCLVPQHRNVNWAPSIGRTHFDMVQSIWIAQEIKEYHTDYRTRIQSIATCARNLRIRQHRFGPRGNTTSQIVTQESTQLRISWDGSGKIDKVTTSRKDGTCIVPFPNKMSPFTSNRRVCISTCFESWAFYWPLGLLSLHPASIAVTSRINLKITMTIAQDPWRSELSFRLRITHANLSNPWKFR